MLFSHNLLRLCFIGFCCWTFSINFLACSVVSPNVKLGAAQALSSRSATEALFNPDSAFVKRLPISSDSGYASSAWLKP